MIRGQFELDADDIDSDDYYCECSGWHYNHEKKKWNRKKGKKARFMVVDEVEPPMTEEPTTTTPATTTPRLCKYRNYNNCNAKIKDQRKSLHLGL